MLVEFAGDMKQFQWSLGHLASVRTTVNFLFFRKMKPENAESKAETTRDREIIQFTCKFWAKLKMFKHFLFVACANLMFSTHEPVAVHKLQCTVKHLYICSTRLTISTAHVYFSHRHEKS